MPALGLENQISNILSLKDGWDDEGAIHVERETADRALKYIPLMQQYALKSMNITLGEPSIRAVPDASIDVHWKDNRFELLMNVTKDKPATYYGDNDKKSVVMRGELYLS